MADLPCDSGGFNCTFSDEVSWIYLGGVLIDSLQDEMMFLDYAACPVEQQPYMCGWVTAGITCNMPVIGASFSMHLCNQHGVIGGDKAKIRCNWTKCETMMNKESLIRHVTEQHLQYRFLCGNAMVFSVVDTLWTAMSRRNIKAAVIASIE